MVEKLYDDNLHAKSVQLSLQGQWDRWRDYIKLDLSSENLLEIQQLLLSFCLGATYDTLRSPSNLYRWHVAPEAVCFLCSKQVCTLAHILGACSLALQQNFYDTVLRVLVSSVKNFLTSYQVSNNKFAYIKLVKAGSRLPKTSKKNKKKKNCGLLHNVPDWVPLSDLESTLVMPPAIANFTT